MEAATKTAMLVAQSTHRLAAKQAHKWTGGTPILSGLIERGIVFLDGTAYIGRASDGTPVQLGDTGDTEGTERYLQTHPSPRCW